MNASPIKQIEDIEAGSDKFESDETKSITTIHSASHGSFIDRRPNPLRSHKKMMNLALEDCGYWCFGVKAIEVWIYTDDGRLENSPGGSWIDQTYFANDDPKVSSALNQLYNSSNPDYEDIATLSYAPGEGLPGALWAETSGNLTASVIQSTMTQDTIHWRDVLGLSIDPDQPYNPRLQLLAKAGFHKAAGVPFDVHGTQGIVIYMARGGVNIEKLCHHTNEQYMISVAESIGAIQALYRPRDTAANTKAADVKFIFKKAMSAYRICAQIGSISHHNNTEKRTESGNLRRVFKTKILIPSKMFFSQWAQKMRGANIKPPPPMPNYTSLFVLLSAFITCFIMLAILESMRDFFDLDPSFITAQLASVTVMVYTLTASPAAQPRSILLGRILAMLVGMAFGCIRIPIGDQFSYRCFLWIRISATVSVTSALMAKLGVPHPPGGSLAVYFGRFSLYDLNGYRSAICLVIHDIIFICLASMINNSNTSRIYPTYWGYVPNMIGTYLRGKRKK